MAYIHEQCLEAWRETSWTSLWECPVCLYRYRVQRVSVYRAVMHRVTLWALTFLLAFGPTLLLAGLLPPSEDRHQPDPLLTPFASMLWLIVGDTAMDYILRFVLGMSIISVIVLGLSYWRDCWPRHVQAWFDGPDPREALAFFMIGGFIYLIQVVYAQLSTILKAVQRGAGDRILEVKKRQ